MKISYKTPDCCWFEAMATEPLLTASNEEYYVDPVDPGFNF